MSDRVIISAIAPNQPGMANNITRLIAEFGAVIIESHMSVMAREFAVIIEVAGSWNALAKLESQLPMRAHQLGLLTTLKRSSKTSMPESSTPYRVVIVALEQPELVAELTDFFATNQINIEEVNCRNFLAPHTAEAMSEVKMTITIESGQDASELNQAFLDFCGEHHLDGEISPLKIS